MYWKGLLKYVDIHVKQCIKSRQQNLHPQCYAQLHFEVPSMPMHFSVMDLIGKFKLVPQGHQNTLTVIDILMNYTWCIPLFAIEADIVVHVYLVNVYSKFGGLHQILSYNGTDFKNKLFM